MCFLAHAGERISCATLSVRCHLTYPIPRRIVRRMEGSMNSITRLVAIYAVGLVLMLPTTPSWGQPVCVAPGCNPTGERR